MEQNLGIYDSNVYNKTLYSANTTYYRVFRSRHLLSYTISDVETTSFF